jgi:hypothetical protein
MKTAILFPVFNRVETTSKVFKAIRQARPPRLYVAADGPRQDRPGEYELCIDTRKVATEVDWPCEVKTLFRENNLGCGRSVSEAITWFFEQELEGIILEDDCLPDKSFFRFCEQLLEKYRHEPRVMTIGGTFIGSGPHKSPNKSPNISTSYFFSRHVECWGWASWRRAWHLFDYHLVNWPHLRNTDWLLRIGDGSQNFQQSWENRFQSVHQGRDDTWAYRWVFSIWFQKGLCILPTKNLVVNIGFNENAAHTKKGDGFHDKLPIESIKFPLSHPNLIERNQEMDKWMDQLYIYIFGCPKPSSMLRKVFRRPVLKVASYSFIIKLIKKSKRLVKFLSN